MLPAACCWDTPSWLQAVEPGTLRMPTFAISQSCLELVVHTCRSHLSPDKFQGHLAFTEVLEAMSELPTSGCVLQRCLLLSCWAWGIFCGLGVSGKQKDFGSWALAGWIFETSRNNHHISQKKKNPAYSQQLESCFNFGGSCRPTEFPQNKIKRTLILVHVTHLWFREGSGRSPTF